ncbi:MAG: hypothetical protein N2578_01005 [Bdellovibrionaceae bacterium]|nr:hypothetical protein [Pseudobdellovibrionaceae bacterium]
MEGLSPTLSLVLWVLEGLQRGESINRAVEGFAVESKGPFKELLLEWLSLIKQNKDTTDFYRKVASAQQRGVLLTLEKGLRGAPIYSILEAIRQELESSCLEQIEEFAATLPMKMLIPLLMLMFPAYLILLFGPLVEQLGRHLSGF